VDKSLRWIVGALGIVAVGALPARGYADDPAPAAPPIVQPTAPRPPAGPAPAATPARPAYPATRVGDEVTVLHGETVPDPYRWLEDDASPEVEAWDAAQEAVVRARLDAVPARATLKARIDAELDLESVKGLPRFAGGRRWWTERPAGKNHAIVHAQKDDDSGPDEVIFDPNAWSADGTEGLKGYTPSPDGRWVAYFRDRKGSENATMHLRDLSTGKDSGLVVTRMKFSQIQWAPDSSGFWYSRLPDPDSVPAGQEQLHRRVRFHRLADPLLLDDELVYGTGRPDIEGMWVGSSTDEKTMFLVRGMPSESRDTFEIARVDGRTVVKPLLVGVDAITHVDKVGETYLLTTDLDAPRQRVCTATAETVGDPKRWTTIVPEGEGVLEDVLPVAGVVVVHARENLVSRIRVLDLEGKDLGEVALPGPGTARGLVTKPGDPRLWFAFESYHLPVTTYVVDLTSGRRPLTELDRAPTTIDVEALETLRSTYPSKDGTRIPIFLLHRKDVPLDGKAPLVLSGYGGFRVGRYPGWSPASALWAELGGVFAVACLRGGDEFGETWHKAGSRGTKQNVYDDLIAGADWLVSTGRAHRDRLAIQGGSNGGLLVAAVANQRPDLCRAVVCSVPLTDMLRYHRFQYAKVWTKEYGDPDVEAEYRWIRPYSPVHNVKAGVSYPASLVTAGLHDGRVNAFHARKIAAAWQAATVSERPILLSIDRASGHGSSSRLQAKADLLDRMCFLLAELEGDALRADAARPGTDEGTAPAPAGGK